MIWKLLSSRFEVKEMKDQKVDAKRDINDEKIENIPQSVKGGVKELEEEFRADGKTIDKEAKRVRRDKAWIVSKEPMTFHPALDMAQSLPAKGGPIRSDLDLQ